MRRLLAMTVLVAACGGDEPKPPPPQKGGTPASSAPAAAAAPKTTPMSFRAKVDQQFRKELSQSDFVPDSSGEINRDPFRSYLVAPAPIGGETTSPDQKDECENRMVAEKSNYGDLRLIGIITRGTRNFAMFKDASQVGQIAYQGDCLSKDKARVLEITPGCVRVEVRAEAPPGAPAPPAREEKVCLHPEDIEIQ
jgi:Tfp pilus assembly protein PilP